jgi:outer membrane protein assembly factor BamB
VYGQPLVVGSLVLVATENNSVYGLTRASGAVRWRRNLGTPVPLRNLPCGNIDPLGITGTPAYDAGTGSVFVVTETTGARHTLVALQAATGSVRWRRGLDVLPNRDRRAEQQRGALAVANGRVYVPFGGLAGDCGNYVGYVTATPVTGRGTTTHYAVPTRREGGIWAPSGVAVSKSGWVWVAVGNGASTSGRYDGSDSVLRLAPDLGRRLDFFAPRQWGSQNAADLDLGSTGPLLLTSRRLMVSGKDGRVYLLDARRLGGIGGQLTSVSGCRGFGGLAYDAARHAAFVPCTSGVLRVDVGSRTLRKRWQAPSSVQGSPVVGGGAVWTLDASRGTLYALSEATGRTLARAGVGAVTRFASPVLSGSTVLVGTRTGVRALRIG